MDIVKSFTYRHMDEGDVIDLYAEEIEVARMALDERAVARYRQLKNATRVDFYIPTTRGVNDEFYDD